MFGMAMSWCPRSERESIVLMFLLVIASLRVGLFANVCKHIQVVESQTLELPNPKPPLFQPDRRRLLHRVV